MAQTSLEFVKTYAASFATLFGTPSTDDRDTSGASSTGAHQSGAIYLNPARRSGARLVLLPLLPPPVPKVDLPSELWRRCITFAMDLTRERATASPQTFSRLLSRRRDLVLVSKMFKNLASSILYAEIKIYTLRSLEGLHLAITAGDQRWDNLRRIPHSTPGRWVQSLDISTLSNDLSSRSSKLRADTLLTEIFRLTPFMTHFQSDPKFALSGRAMKALSEGRPSILRVIKGLSAGDDSMSMPPNPWLLAKDPLVALVRACALTLETLEVVGPGATQDEEELAATILQYGLSFSAILLPHLQTLSLNGVPCSPLFYTLINSSIPSLTRLTLTVYPSRYSRDTQSPSAAFLASHGKTIESLILPTPPDWPPPDYVGTFTVPPQGSRAYFDHSILHLLPKLERLNLSFPLPPLLLISRNPTSLKTLLFPRPIPALLPFILELAQSRDEKGSGLKKVVWTKSRWLRRDVGATSRMARTAGDQAEMLRWRRALVKLDVQLIDADGKAV